MRFSEKNYLTTFVGGLITTVGIFANSSVGMGVGLGLGVSATLASFACMPYNGIYEFEDVRNEFEFRESVLDDLREGALERYSKE